MTIPPIRYSRRAMIGAAGAALAAPRSARSEAASPIVLGWRAVSPSGVIVLAAMRNGMFAARGAAVRLRAEQAGDPPPDQLLRSGAIDACVVPAPMLLRPLSQGLDARFTAGLSGGGVRLLTDRRSRILHIEDVRHRRVGVLDVDGSTRLFFSIMIRRKGIDPFRDVTWVAVPAAGTGDAVRDGTVDAIALSDPAAFALGRELRLREVASNISGSYRERTYAALAVSGRLLDAGRRRSAAALTRALLDGAAFLASEPRSAASFAAELAPASLDPADATAMFRTEAADQHPTGNALADDLAAYVDELRLLGTLPFELNSGRFARSVCEDLASS